MKKSILALSLLLLPIWVNAACNSTYTLPINEWHLISLPCAPGNNNSLVNVLGDDISGELDQDWSVYKFDANSQNYVALKNTDALKQGQGYWIIYTNDANGNSVELDMPSSSTSTKVSHPAQCSSGNGCFDIPLQAHQNEMQWNLLGHPFTSNHTWNDSQIVTNNSCNATACSVSQASSDDKNILDSAVWRYDAGNGEYVSVSNTEKLTPWSGFWTATLENAFAEGNPRLLIPSNNTVVDNPSNSEQQKFLNLVNNARRQSRTCGGRSYPSVPDLTLNSKLYAAALEHSKDLAISNTFSHTGSGTASDISGVALNKRSSVGDRIEHNGYSWSAYGENIAAGQPTIESAMQGWLDSPGHCANIMNPNVTGLGMAKYVREDSFYRIYWTQNFGRPRNF